MLNNEWWLIIKIKGFLIGTTLYYNNLNAPPKNRYFADMLRYRCSTYSNTATLSPNLINTTLSKWTNQRAITHRLTLAQLTLICMQLCAKVECEWKKPHDYDMIWHSWSLCQERQSVYRVSGFLRIYHGTKYNQNKSRSRIRRYHSYPHQSTSLIKFPLSKLWNIQQAHYTSEKQKSSMVQILYISAENVRLNNR